MRRNPAIILFSGLLLLICLAGCGGSDTAITQPQEEALQESFFQDPMAMPDRDEKLPDHMAGEVVVNYHAGTLPETIAASVKGKVIETFFMGPGLYARIGLPSGSSVVESVNTLRQFSGVVYAEPNYTGHAFLIPDDTYYSLQYGPQNCFAEAGWDITTGSSSVVIAVVDTGVNGLHNEFSGKMTGGYDFVNNLALTGGENSDDYGHGTHVAGIAAAVGNNGNGIAGVAWGCEIMPVKVLNSSGSGTYTQIASGITWAATNGADVINMSLGGAGYSQLLNDAVKIAVDNGVVVVVSMGNDYQAKVNSPAVCQGVIAVGALNAKDEVTDFSTGGNHISIAAPGEAIYSTSNTGGYVYMSGTSMSCPFVSGVCALILSQHPGITPEEVKSQLEETAVDAGPAGWDKETGYGKPDIASALDTLQPNKYGRVTVDIVPDTSGLSVVLYDNNGNMKAATVSDASPGNAYFFHIPAGTYVVKTYHGGSVKGSITFSVTAGNTASVTLTL